MLHQDFNIFGSDGNPLTDFDLVLRNAVLQIKSGGGKGLVGQILMSEGLTDLPVIGYGPDLKGSVMRNALGKGCLVTKDLKTLLDVVAP